ncbi:hypothetical protein S40285_10617, partial [Stachybotrys chlorohalonatus IBT 40285]
GASDDPVI